MKKFLVLYAADFRMFEEWKKRPEEDGQKEMQDWATWMKKYDDILLQPGNPSGKNTRVTKDGTEEQANEVCGYSVFQVAEKAEVLAALDDCPHLAFEGTYCEVMELIDM